MINTISLQGVNKIFKTMDQYNLSKLQLLKFRKMSISVSLSWLLTIKHLSDASCTRLIICQLGCINQQGSSVLLQQPKSRQAHDPPACERGLPSGIEVFFHSFSYLRLLFSAKQGITWFSISGPSLAVPSSSSKYGVWSILQIHLKNYQIHVNNILNTFHYQERKIKCA